MATDRGAVGAGVNTLIVAFVCGDTARIILENPLLQVADVLRYIDTSLVVAKIDLFICHEYTSKQELCMIAADDTTRRKEA